MNTEDSGTMQKYLADRLLPQVQRVMQISDVTEGGREQGFAVRFRGKFLIDTEKAFEQLTPVFAREDSTLLFRSEGDTQVVLAIHGRVDVSRSNPWVNLILFVLTVFSVLFSGVIYSLDQATLDANHGNFLLAATDIVPEILSFSVSLLVILLAHEFGHYLAAYRHGTAVTLPYFLPFPGSYFGTLGAFIQIKERPRNRKVLLDIGLAGPLAGLAITIPVLLIGLSLSEVAPLQVPPGNEVVMKLEGNSIFYLLAKYLVKGAWLPTPVDYGGVSHLVYWARFILLGQPVPIGGMDVMLHPMAWAGWAGLLVTGLNLIPVGQLDGGHLLYVLFGEKARRVLPVAIAILVGLGFVWSGWWLWAGLLLMFGRVHAQPLDAITPLNRERKLLAVFGLILFVLLFIPVPLQFVG